MLQASHENGLLVSDSIFSFRLKLSLKHSLHCYSEHEQQQLFSSWWGMCWWREIPPLIQPAEISQSELRWQLSWLMLTNQRQGWDFPQKRFIFLLSDLCHTIDESNISTHISMYFSTYNIYVCTHISMYILIYQLIYLLYMSTQW